MSWFLSIFAHYFMREDMPSVEIRKVTDRRELDAFIQFHYDLYRGNEYDAPNLYQDELHTLSKD